MSEVFTFTPGGSETIDQFNARVAQFCNDNNIVDVYPSCGGKTLVLSLTEPDDLPFPMPFAYQPYVMLANEADMPGLEKTLGAVIEKLVESVAAAGGMEVDDVFITRTQLIPLPSQPSSSYVVMLVVIGVVEADSE